MSIFYFPTNKQKSYRIDHKNTGSKKQYNEELSKTLRDLFGFADQEKIFLWFRLKPHFEW